VSDPVWKYTVYDTGIASVRRFGGVGSSLKHRPQWSDARRRIGGVEGLLAVAGLDDDRASLAIGIGQQQHPVRRGGMLRDQIDQCRQKGNDDQVHAIARLLSALAGIDHKLGATHAQRHGRR
jgi:hypothetical protein